MRRIAWWWVRPSNTDVMSITCPSVVICTTQWTWDLSWWSHIYTVRDINWWPIWFIWTSVCSVNVSKYDIDWDKEKCLNSRVVKIIECEFKVCTWSPCRHSKDSDNKWRISSDSICIPETSWRLWFSANRSELSR